VCIEKRETHKSYFQRLTESGENDKNGILPILSLSLLLRSFDSILLGNLKEEEERERMSE
jgi:hypothetical protein